MSKETPTENDTFESWFDRQDFKFFSAQELLWYFDKKNRGVKNSTPPKSLWKNIIPTLRFLDILREEVGKPIYISSSYRSPAYNATLEGAASKSFHMQFKAVDFQVLGMTPRAVHTKIKELRSRGKFKGGLGLYQTFVHVDTRGYDANWGISN